MGCGQAQIGGQCRTLLKEQKCAGHGVEGWWSRLLILLAQRRGARRGNVWEPNATAPRLSRCLMPIIVLVPPPVGPLVDQHRLTMPAGSRRDGLDHGMADVAGRHFGVHEMCMFCGEVPQPDQADTMAAVLVCSKLTSGHM